VAFFQQKEGQYNFCGYESPEVDRWLVEARATFDTGRRRALYHKIHARIAETFPISSSIVRMSFWRFINVFAVLRQRPSV